MSVYALLFGLALAVSLVIVGCVAALDTMLWWLSRRRRHKTKRH